jgi:hypothetical protein
VKLISADTAPIPATRRRIRHATRRAVETATTPTRSLANGAGLFAVIGARRQTLNQPGWGGAAEATATRTGMLANGARLHGGIGARPNRVCEVEFVPRTSISAARMSVVREGGHRVVVDADSSALPKAMWGAGR